MLTVNRTGAIALAVYKPDAQLLAEQIRSIAAQTLEHWLCHIGIDGSDSLANELVGKLIRGDDRFVLHSYPENVGIYRNFERLVEEISPDAPWFALSDQDDSWDVDKLERMVAALDEDGIMAVIGQARLVDREGGRLGMTNRRNVPLPALLMDNQVTGSLALFRREVLDLALPFPPPTPAAYHDHWLGVVAAGSGRISFLSEDVQDYVQHGANALGEENRRDPGTRLRALAGSSRNPLHMLDRLAVERWGWRQTMAVTLAGRLQEDAAASREIAPFLMPGRPGLLRVVARSLARREVGAQRTLAIWVGSLWASLRPSRLTHEMTVVG
ncbi:glycosyltransferase [Nocardioides lacusdianchii]|uniref:glycosyltransferase n=1 Tax=Nocardioides lacusdianchii TaxID=2783664 RepID=UPI001CCB99D2|nr:glycosyltransferase [Nocardioides lacusdianchii]